MENIKENSQISRRKCCIKTCKKSKLTDPSLKMFQFPPYDTPMGQIWREKCEIKIVDYEKRFYICQYHFPPSSIGKRFLRRDAVPCLNIKEHEDDFNFPDTEILGNTSGALECCSNCAKMAKSVEFYKKKYNQLFFKYTSLRKKNINNKKGARKLENVIDGIQGISKENKILSKLLLHSRPQFYNSEVRDLVQNIFYVSQSTYKFLRNKLNLNLPHMKTINRWAPIKSLQPGFKNNGIEYIKKKCCELPEREKNNILLLLDEMAIRPELRYNSKLDLVDGFVDDGFRRTNAVGKYVCVFMAKSILSNWGVVLNYFIPKTGFSGAELKRLILENLEILKTFGVKVKLITCDQGSANVKCYTDLGISVEKPFFLHDGRKIFCLFDFPHLIKSLRNNWMSCDIHTLDGLVSFKVLHELWEMDSKNTTKLCPKLTFQHLYPNSFQKMRVKLATQIFSHTVEAAINTINQTVGFKKCSKELASATASFVGKINKLFDCLNSSTLHCSNPFKSAIKNNNVPHLFIKNFQNYLEEMSFVANNKNNRVKFLEGMRQTLNAVLMLVEELFSNNDDLFFLMTRALNQDKLENMFSILRQKGGNNNNPSVAEINSILARLMTAKIVQLSSSTNCEEITDSTLEIISDVYSEEQGTGREHIDIEVYNTEEILDNIIENSVSVVVDSFQDSDKISADITSLRYFIGYVAFKMLKKINCEQCNSDLTKEEVLSQPSELFIFHKNFNCVSDFGKLVAPSDTFMNASKIFVNIFQNVFSNQPHRIGLKKFIVNLCRQTCPEWFSSCPIHKEIILDFMILVLLRKHCSWVTPENSKKKLKKLKIMQL